MSKETPCNIISLDSYRVKKAYESIEPEKLAEIIYLVPFIEFKKNMKAKGFK